MSEASHPANKRPPKYCRQREKNRPDRAYVLIDGKKILLGVYRSSESEQRYKELIGETSLTPIAPSSNPTVAEVMVAFLEFAKGYYRKNGEVTREYETIRETLKFVRRKCSTLPAKEFGPKRLKEVRESMIKAGHCRKYINKNVDRIRRMFRWAAAEEMIDASIPQGLSMVTGLRQGRSEAPDHPPVLPVDDATIDATLPHLPAVVADMVRLQRATGMRPQEVRTIRPCDIDRSGKVWIYRPAIHKTQHQGKDRQVLIGPRGQEVLLRYLARDAQTYCFRPCDSEEKRQSQRRAARKTPESCGNVPGSNRVEDPKKQPGECYSKDSYVKAITRACTHAFPAPKGTHGDELKAWRAAHRWSPNQLRHAAATEIRSRFGLEAAQVILGHSAADTTQIYAARDLAKGVEVAEAVG